MKENYRWIKVRFFGNGEEISVRQHDYQRDLFLGEDGHTYHIEELDFTQLPENEESVANSVKNQHEEMKRMDDAQDRAYKQLQNIVEAMDTRAFADHQAEIDERAYWMKLRGEIFSEILSAGGEFNTSSELDWAANQTERMFDALYAQHQKFINKG